MGYGWVQVSMGAGLLSLPIWIVVLLPFVKIVATGLTIGSGGSGGIFGPGMVIGGMLGATVWRLSYAFLPGVPSDPTPFVIVGMMALFGGIAHAPLAVMLMVAEMTGNLSLLAPAMIAVGISSILVGNSTIYTSQVDTRADSPAHRLEFTFPLLSTLTVRLAMKPPRFTFSPAQSVADAEQTLNEQNGGISGAPVLDGSSRLLGTLTRADIQRVPLAERENRTVREAMHKDVLLVQPEEALDDALEQLTEHQVSWAPVVNDIDTPGDKNIAGLLTVADIMQTYRQALANETKQMRKLVDTKPNIDT